MNSDLRPDMARPTRGGLAWSLPLGVPIILDVPRSVVRPGANICFFDPRILSGPVRKCHRFTGALESDEHIKLDRNVAEHVPWHHYEETFDEEIAVADAKPEVGSLPREDEAGNDGERVSQLA